MSPSAQRHPSHTAICKQLMQQSDANVLRVVWTIIQQHVQDLELRITLRNVLPSEYRSLGFS